MAKITRWLVQPAADFVYLQMVSRSDVLLAGRGLRLDFDLRRPQSSASGGAAFIIGGLRAPLPWRTRLTAACFRSGVKLAVLDGTDAGCPRRRGVANRRLRDAPRDFSTFGRLLDRGGWMRRRAVSSSMIFTQSSSPAVTT